MRVKVNSLIDKDVFEPHLGDIAILDGTLYILQASQFDRAYDPDEVRYGYVRPNQVSTYNGWSATMRIAFEKLSEEGKTLGHCYFPVDNVQVTIDWVY